MIVGLGSDLVVIDRIESALNRFGEKFARRILTDSEMQSWQAGGKTAAWLAKRFAAKEAALKALGTGLAQGINWHQIQTSHSAAGAPLIEFLDVAAKKLKSLGAETAWLTLSDEQNMAMAVVVLEGSHK